MRTFAQAALPVVFTAALLIVGAPMILHAAPVPEIDPSTGASALAAVAGAALILRAGRKK